MGWINPSRALRLKPQQNLETASRSKLFLGIPTKLNSCCLKLVYIIAKLVLQCLVILKCLDDFLSLPWSYQKSYLSYDTSNFPFLLVIPQEKKTFFSESLFLWKFIRILKGIAKNSADVKNTDLGASADAEQV